MHIEVTIQKVSKSKENTRQLQQRGKDECMKQATDIQGKVSFARSPEFRETADTLTVIWPYVYV